MTQKAFQDYYEDHSSQCYGCGRLNARGLQIKSYWDGDETICRFMPEPYFMSVPGYAYGGLIASVIDCHSTATAAAAAYRAAGRDMGTRPALRFVTASLHVDYLKPTPIDAEMVLRGRVVEITDRKVVVAVALSVKEVVCARGRVVAVRAPDRWPSG